MTVAAKSSRMTLDEFLAWEATQQERHEFVDGEAFAMAGGTLVHSRITLNIATALDGQLGGRGCEVLASDAQVLAGQNIFYPDVIVACGPDALEGNQVRAPVFIAEVLSPSTERYDRGSKWQSYQESLPSLRTFLFVAEDRIAVEVYRRSGRAWTYSSHTRLDEVIELSAPPCRLTLAQIYARVAERISAADGV